jgi:alkaline phosphatase
MRKFGMVCAAMMVAVMMLVPQVQAGNTAKYVFVFIGDGMGVAQRNAAELYLANQQGADRPEQVKLLMNTFPAQGMNTTYDLSSVIPDSASTATAITTGFKTKSGVIGMDADGKIAYETIAQVAKQQGWKIGVLSSVSLDHATPAAFFAHVPSRSMMYDICMQLVNSGFDYFAGGQMKSPADPKDASKPNALDVAVANGYTIAMGRAEFEALPADADKVIAMNTRVDKDAAMYYTLDQAGDPEHVTLAEYVAKGIDVLDNPNGFLMAVESGKIDWACHANDAAASILDTLAFDDAVAEAVKFYEQHPNDTLIIVTGDHETGGMTIGFAGTQYASFVDKIQYQTMTYIEFGKQLAEFKQAHSVETAVLEDVMPMITQAFGLYMLSDDEKAALVQAVADGKAEGASDDAKKAGSAADKTLRYSLALTDLEIGVLREAFTLSMMDVKEVPKNDYTYLHYGGYEPLTMKLTTILNNKSGIDILNTGIICAFGNLPPAPSEGGGDAPSPLGRAGEGFLEKRNVCRC